jgi:hypothetical protein
MGIRMNSYHYLVETLDFRIKERRHQGDLAGLEAWRADRVAHLSSSSTADRCTALPKRSRRRAKRRRGSFARA